MEGNENYSPIRDKGADVHIGDGESISESELSEELSPFKPSQKKQLHGITFTLSWEHCLCKCYLSEDHASFNDLREFKEQSWKTFISSANERDDDVWHFIKSSGDLKTPRGFYHRMCYQKYTLKKNVDLAKAHGAVLSETVEETLVIPSPPEEGTYKVPIKRSLRGYTKKLDKTKCIICQGEKKRKAARTGRKVVEPLTKCTQADLTDESKLIVAAQTRDDDDLLRELQSGPSVDLVAGDTLYHSSCYSNYIHPKTLARITRLKSKNVQGLDPYSEAMQSIHTKLVQISNGEVVARLSYIRKIYCEQLDSLGCPTNSSYRSDRLKKRINNEFGDIAFYQPRDRSSQIVYSSTINPANLLDLMDQGILECSKDDAQSSSDEEDCEIRLKPQHELDQDSWKDLFWAAITIREHILMQNSKTQWPNRASDVDLSCTGMPDSLNNFLIWLLKGAKNYEIFSKHPIKVEGKLKQQVESLGQDIVFLVSKGKHAPPKHIVLASTVYHLTRSKKLLTILNRFGHCIAASQVHELNTALAEQQLLHHNDNNFLPITMKHGPWANFCWDNNDLCEETVTGGGTLHCTMGIVLQRKAYGPENQQDVVKRCRRRSLLQVNSNVLDYNRGKKAIINPTCTNEDTFESIQDNYKDSHENPKLLDWIWLLCRYMKSLCSITGSIPAWSGFNAKMSTPKNETIVTYLPAINAPPTQMDVVYTLLVKSNEMSKKLGQSDTIVVMDQAVYAKAVEVKYRRQDEFKSTVLRLGEFHICCTMLAVIGVRFRNSGLEEIMVESGIVSAGSVNGVMSGKHYNRSLRCHKYVMEALARLWFNKQLSETNNEIQIDEIPFKKLIEKISNEQQSFNSDTITEIKKSAQISSLKAQFETPIAENPTLSYWKSYIDMVLLLLRFIRATREGNWKLHLACVREMLPWMFCYDGTNYARYMSLYWFEMTLLPNTHPGAAKALTEGEFSAQRSKNAFAQVPIDQTIDQTINRQSKTPGGIIGISLNAVALQQWVLIAHERAALTDKCCSMVNLRGSEEGHKDGRKATMKRDENNVNKVISIMKSWMDPFEITSKSLINIASGMIATTAIQLDISSAKTKGEKAFEKFVTERLVNNITDFNDVLPNQKLKTFKNTMTATKSKVGEKLLTLKADVALFSRFAALAQARSMDMRDVLKYPLGPIPWSLAMSDGTQNKTDKAALKHLLLGTDKDCLLDVMPPSIHILDGMAILQSFQGLSKKATFADIAKALLTTIMSKERKAGERVDVVFDTYPDFSIKGGERLRRGNRNSGIAIHSRNQFGPNSWSSFLKISVNKTNLVEFLVSEWENADYVTLIGTVPFYVTQGENCWKFCVVDQKIVKLPVANLCCTHEEADTRLLLHAMHAYQTDFNKSNAIAIWTPDTDVMVIGTSVALEFGCEILVKTIGKNSTIINLTKIAKALGSHLESLIGLHALTGCDSTSAFKGKGKKTAFKILLDGKFDRYLSCLGQNSHLCVDDINGLEQFVCALYGKPNCNNINEVRYNLFCTKNCQSAQLPPCQSTMLLHFERANYQAAVWRQCLVAKPSLLDATACGWQQVDGALVPKWLQDEPAPRHLLALISCACKGECKTNACSCRANTLNCTDVCKCNSESQCCNRKEDTTTLTDNNRMDDMLINSDSESDDEHDSEAESD